MAPVVGLILIPAGGSMSEKVRAFGGRSMSVAAALTFSGNNSSMIWLGGTVNSGATLISRMTTGKLLVRENERPFTTSVTLTMMVFVCGPSTSAVLQPTVALVAPRT